MSAIAGIAGCTGTDGTDESEENGNTESSPTSSQTSTDNSDVDVPTFGLPQCSDSTYIEITKIEGYDAVIKNTGVNRRAVDITAYTDDPRKDTQDGFLSTSPITEYYLIEAGSTLGVELPGDAIYQVEDEGVEAEVSFPVDQLVVNSAPIDDGEIGELEPSGCINPSNLEYDSDIHELQTYETRDATSDWFDFTIGVTKSSTQGYYIVPYLIQLSETWSEENPNPELELKIELELPSGETVSSTSVISNDYHEGSISDVWSEELDMGEANDKFSESTYRVYVNGDELLAESCSDLKNLGIGNGCKHEITTDSS